MGLARARPNKRGRGLGAVHRSPGPNPFLVRGWGLGTRQCDVYVYAEEVGHGCDVM